ncbi:hypothetical protein [Nonomuraea sp. NPDC049709]|uniref:hypothetical protein n=1 Tax=Nonomuraea sp. NPDC049709 TaxID=3154736 RepID=UPI003425131E
MSVSSSDHTVDCSTAGRPGSGKLADELGERGEDVEDMEDVEDEAAAGGGGVEGFLQGPEAGVAAALIAGGALVERSPVEQAICAPRAEQEPFGARSRGEGERAPKGSD